MKPVGYVLWPLLAMLAAVPSALAAEAEVPRCFDPPPIDEVFRVMLGRESTPTESAHYAALILSGAQFAYFEPYLVKDCENDENKSLCTQTASCGSFIGVVSDPARSGIPYYLEDDWNRHLAARGMFVTSLYRTLFGKLPDSTELARWVGEFKKFGDRPEGLPKVSAEMIAELPAKAPGFWDVVDEISLRVRGRPASHEKCSLRETTAPEAGSDCFFFWSLANGKMPINEVIHGIRSTAEAIRANESESCYRDHPTQIDSHALGEYVRLLYRLLLKRMPTANEVTVGIGSYRGGDTGPYLRAVGKRIVESSEYAKSCPVKQMF